MAEPRTAIGISMTGKTLCRVELVRSGAQLRLVSLQTSSLLGGSAGANPVADVDARTIAAIPGVDAMTRCWVLPDGERSRLRQMLANRLEAESPVPVEELAWSYRVGESVNGSGTRPVLVQAARNSRIAQHLASLRSKGCEPDVLTTEAEGVAALVKYALARESGVQETGTSVPSSAVAELLVLATASEWTACVLVGGLVRCVRRVRVDMAQPELAYRQLGRIVESELGQTTLQRIAWCGACEADLENLAAWLGTHVERLEPTPRLVKSDGASLNADELATYGPAVGLALAALYDDRDVIGLVVARREEGKSTRLDWVFAHPWRWAAAAAVACIVAMIVHMMILRHETRLMQAAQQNARNPMADLDPKVRSMLRLEGYRIDVEGITAELCRTIPPSVIVQSVQIARERRLSIKGTSGDAKAIYAWVDALRKSNRFSAVNPERTAPGQGGDFTITADLNGVQKLTATSGRGGTWR